MAYVTKYSKSVKGMIMINCTLSMKESFCNSWIPKAAELGGVCYTMPDTSSPDSIFNKMMEVAKAMEEKGARWKMAFSDEKNDSVMNSTYSGFSKWNGDFGSVALNIQDYWKDCRAETSGVKVPVLFYYGYSDWMVGPKHYEGVKFPKMMLWGSEVGHMPFLENRADLERAIDKYIVKYKF